VASTSVIEPRLSKLPGCRSRRHAFAATTGIVYGGSARPTEGGGTRGGPGSSKASALHGKRKLLPVL
jgi:hypothetical protein